MDILTVFDRGSDNSRSEWVRSTLETEKNLKASIRHQKETSEDRVAVKKRINNALQKWDLNPVAAYENYDINALFWYCVYEFEDWVLNVSYYSNHAYFEVISNDIKFSEEMAKKFAKLIPPVKEPEEDHVSFAFYMLGNDGRTAKILRSLLTPEWSEIERNYQEDTRQQLSDLVNLDPEKIGDGGKLVLLHGPPGLGKSYAIRALMRGIKSWAKPYYLMDPEKFFQVPPYMFEILLGQAGGYDYTDTNDKWRIIIAEDSDEFLRADAKERSGQGLSRLLNLTDGILGQGMKVIILLTTNEPLTNLHPAVIRPGRCIANIEFKTFNTIEAQAWLGESLPSYKQYSLAELYDKKRVQQQIKEEKIPVATGQYL